MKMNIITPREQAHLDKLKAAALRTEKAYMTARDNWLAARVSMAVKYGPRFQGAAELEEVEA